MRRRIGLRGNEAVALAVKLANVDFIASYPITPQTLIVERLSEYVTNGELDAEFINFESEHSALSACIGASAIGARTFTATCSQGLALMHEIVYITAGLRLPVVMAIAHRALSAPLNVGADHGDTMAERDSGWIQIFVENCQEAFDSTIQAFKIAEDLEVLLPVMVCMDGFYLSHAVEAVEVPSKDEVEKYLPPRKPVYKLDPKEPITVGSWVDSEYYILFKMEQEKAMRKAKEIIKKTNEEFRTIFGRSYGDGLIDSYKLNDADIALITLGSMSGTARTAIELLRKDGKKVGLLRIRAFRPFPSDEIRTALKDVKVVAVVSRDISLGSFGGALLTEIRSSLYELKERPHVAGFVAGLGGADIRVEDFCRIVENTYEIFEKDRVEKDFIFVISK